MKIAVYSRQKDHMSLRIYRENVVAQLEGQGVTIIPFAENEAIPDGCDLLWDPGLGMRRVSNRFRGGTTPLIVTMHGLRAFSLPLHDAVADWKSGLKEQVKKARIAHGWRWMRRRVAAIITVSEFGADDTAVSLNLPRSLIYPIHHGVDHQIFTSNGAIVGGERPYFFIVSVYDQPRKNIQRLLAAYEGLTEDNRPDLVIKLTNYPSQKIDIPSVRIIGERIAAEELAQWYRGALGFVFPSLYENFGMPIIEAMACGCPVITSNVTACPEVAGDAALLVDPRSVDSIREAMARLSADDVLRQDLREKGLARAAQFTWGKSAQEHLDMFQQVVKKGTM